MFKKLSTLILGLALSCSAFAIDIKDLTKKANDGDTKAQTELAVYYQNKQDYKNMFIWMSKLAEQGNAGAQYNLGLMYYEGKGVRQDYHKTVEWLTVAANQGDAEAQNNLGMMYSKGLGVKQNKSVAKQWYSKACDNGVQIGCNNYRHLNEQGY